MTDPGLVTDGDGDMNGSLVEDVGDSFEQYFRTVHSRRLATLNKTYPLPVDQEDVKVSSLLFTQHFDYQAFIAHRVPSSSVSISLSRS